MKKTITIITIAILGLCLTTQARSIRDFFASEPDNIFMLIPANTRLDMLDYLDVGKTVTAQNNLGDGSMLTKVTPDYISVKVTESSDVEMMMLCPSKNDTVIVVSSTVTLPARDSRLTVYDENWDELQLSKFIKLPTIKDFIKATSGKGNTVADIMDAIEIPFISYSINPDTKAIIAHQNLQKFMNKEDYGKIAPYLLDSITYNLSGKKFKQAPMPMPMSKILYPFR